MPRHAPVLSLSIKCHLRELRGNRKLLALEDQIRINAGTLSQLESGQRLPRPDQVERLEQVYGPRRGWYSVEMVEAS